jgi:hypothetical protein
VISLLPAIRETIVLPLAAEIVFERLSASTSNQIPISKGILFSGWVRLDRFRISLRQRRPSNYAPIVVGIIEPTSNGCILFVDYKLVPSMRVFIMFWTLLIVLGSLVSGLQFKNIAYTFAGLAILGFIYWIVWSNFKLQIKPAHQALLGLFS